MNDMSLPQTIWSNYWFKNLILPFAVFFAFYFTRKVIVNCIFHPFLKLGKRTGSKRPEQFKDGFEKPLRILFLSVGIFVAFRVCPAVYYSGSSWPIIVKCFRSLLVFLFAWGLYRMAGSKELTEALFAKKFDLQTDSVIVPVVSNLARFVIAALAVLIIAQEWNYSISGLLAGLGLGGLAFALAAKDMLANIFGGLIILLDKPFSLGDWISTGDVEGTVEDINFRSVKVRTFSQAVVTVPNAKLADAPVTNYSRMGKRKVTFNIGLKFGTTVKQMKACTEKIRQMLLDDDNIDNETIIAVFDSFGESSLNLMLYFFTKTTDWKEYLDAREKVYYAVLDILESEKAQLALPTRTLHIEK